MVSDATLRTDVWTAVRTILVSAALQVTDGSTVKNATVGAAYNDKNTSKPQVIIYPMSHDESEYKFGSDQGKKLINVTLEAYYSNTLGVDQLSDQIDVALKETPISGAELIGVTSDYTFTNPLESKFHSNVMTYTYDRE